MVNQIKNIYIGPAGWSYPDWKGIVYPVSQPAQFNECKYLAQFFDTIEINSTFYRIPYPVVVKKWVENAAANPRFRFCVKLWQGFTHTRQNYSDKDVAGFCAAIDPLYNADRLGALLIQFPWSFKNTPESMDYLIHLAAIFEKYPRVVELRHSSWLTPEVMTAFRDHQIGFANIDQPVIGQSIPLTHHLTAEVGYLRLHGRNYQNWFKESAGRDARYNYLYSGSEMDSWIKDIQEMAQDAQSFFVVFNNHFKGQAIVNSFQLIAKLTGQKIQIPQHLLHEYPILQDIGEPQGSIQLDLL
jgi:uncharacterized protein YecE (DUF72 family)